jgi:hypothetical protein
MRCNPPSTRAFLLFVPLLVMAGPTGGCDDHRFRLRTPPGVQVDVFRQATVPQVDVLWVVDNSSSMGEEQQALARNFEEFYKYMEQLVDPESEEEVFHIGVISTDVYDPDHQGKLLGNPNIITDATPNAAEVFAQNVNVGLLGKADEQGFYAAELALTEPLISTFNAGFLRDDAYLFIIFVSDEDDCSFGEAGYYLRRFLQIKGTGNDGMVKAAAVVGDVPEVPDWCQKEREKPVLPGVRYAELAEGTEGLVLSICDEDFAKSLDQLGFSAAGLRRHFTLTRRAIATSIQVWVKWRCSDAGLDAGLCEPGGFFNDCGSNTGSLYGKTCILKQSLPDGWAFEEDTNSIRFYGEAVPPFRSVIEVGYTPEEGS